MAGDEKKYTYTCKEYRDEMILAGLQKRLQQADLSKKERRSLLQEIDKLEKKMGL